MKSKIVLIGFMGSGKSTLGKELSDKLGLFFFDVDAYIEEKYQREIKEIFAKEGEEAFRRMETEALKEILLKEEEVLVSTGGGVVTREENVALLKEKGLVFYLKAGVETILSRLKGDVSRPLLQSEDLEKKIRELMAHREGAYLEAADYVIPTDGTSVPDLVEECFQILKAKRKNLDKNLT